MKFDKQLKDKIDSYFDSISADELYAILTEKYNFSEAGGMIYADIVVKQEVEVVKIKFIEGTSHSESDEAVSPSSSIPLAA